MSFLHVVNSLLDFFRVDNLDDGIKIKPAKNATTSKFNNQDKSHIRELEHKPIFQQRYTWLLLYLSKVNYQDIFRQMKIRKQTVKSSG